MTLLCLLLLLLKLLKCSKGLWRFAKCKFAIEVQFLTSYTFAERDFVTYTVFLFATCKFATCMFSPPNMIKVVLKCS